ncbi:MAG: MATE family efflux transporter, partial [Anaerotignum sp.]
LLVLAAPLLIGNIFQQFYNTMDAVIIGRYVGQEAFAAIGIAGTVMNLFIFLLGGCCTGVSILLARLFGSGNKQAFRQESFMAFFFGTLFAVLLSVVSILILPYVLRLIQTPPELFVPIRQYLVIVLGGLTVTFLYNLYAASLRAIGDTKMALLFLIIAILLNTALDVVFISFLGWGIAGAAWATVFSQCVAAIGCGAYMKKRMPDLVFQKEDRKIDWRMLKETFQFTFISALQQSSLYIGKLLVQGTVNDLGIASISAYTAAGRIEGFINSFGDSGADAISIFVAQNIGAGNVDRARQGFFKGRRMMVLLLVVFSTGMFAFAKELLFLVLGNAPEAVTVGSEYLKGIAFLYFFCFLGASFVGWYRGSGRVNIPFIGTTLHISIRVILSVVLSSTMGLKGVAYATGICWMCVVSFQVIYYLIRGKTPIKPLD